jgi:hypothetical protein
METEAEMETETEIQRENDNIKKLTNSQVCRQIKQAHLRQADKNETQTQKSDKNN